MFHKGGALLAPLSTLNREPPNRGVKRFLLGHDDVDDVQAKEKRSDQYDS